jgi:hypothetical protein
MNKNSIELKIDKRSINGKQKKKTEKKENQEMILDEYGKTKSKLINKSVPDNVINLKKPRNVKVIPNQVTRIIHQKIYIEQVPIEDKKVKSRLSI